MEEIKSGFLWSSRLDRNLATAEIILRCGHGELDELRCKLAGSGLTFATVHPAEIGCATRGKKHRQQSQMLIRQRPVAAIPSDERIAGALVVVETPLPRAACFMTSHRETWTLTALGPLGPLRLGPLRRIMIATIPHSPYPSASSRPAIRPLPVPMPQVPAGTSRPDLGVSTPTIW